MAYDSSYFQQEGETLAEFMQRLAKTRAAGVLGGGGMFYEKPSETTPAETVSIDTVNNAITSAPLGMMQVNTSSDTATNGWDKVKTLEQRTAEAIARQTQMNDPRAVDALGIVAPAWMAAGAKAIEDWSDKSAINSYLEKAGITDPEERDWLSKNPSEVLMRMSEGILPAVGGFQNYNMDTYKKQDWGDFANKVGNDIVDALSNVGGVVKGLFGGEYSATPSAAGQYMGFNFTPTVGSIDMIGNTPINTLEDLYNLSTVGNSSQGFGNYNPNTGMYTIGTAANKNADGSYTIGTSYNQNNDNSYTIGSTEGSSPIAATNTTPDWYSAATGESWDY
jgi:hypothetical protein